MIDVSQTKHFSQWLGNLQDRQARARILRRLDRAREGNLGDVAAVGGGVSEMRIFYGPGYRIYFVRRGPKRIVLLCGGDKSTQTADTEEAKSLAQRTG